MTNMTELKDNYDFEERDGIGGISCGARYLMDTVLHHEEGTSALYRIKKYLQYVNGLTLELGCNAGGVTMTISQQASFVIGVDFISRFLKVANQKMKQINANKLPKEENWCHPPTWKVNCGWVCASVTSLPFRNEMFDTILYPEIIEHLPRKERPRMIKEAYRMLKGGGTFILSTPIDVNDPDRPNWMEEILSNVHPFGLETRERVEKFIRRAGFRIVEVEDDWHDKIQVLFIRAVK